MFRARVAVLKVASGEATVTDAAVEYGLSRRHLHRLLARYRQGGLDALEPRSRRPNTTPIAASEEVRARVIELRRQLGADGLDAGPVTIAWHLEREGLRALSTSTIRRILHEAGLITPQPRKRPRSSYIRFEADQPNEMWQSDFMHWRLADGTEVEVLNWLDDHSRYLLSVTAHQPVTGDDVVAAFLAVVGDHGAPASTLTDNGSVYTSRFTGGRNALIPPALARCSPEERVPRASADPGQDRAVSPDPAALAGGPTSRQQHPPAAAPARRVPRALQRAAPPPSPAPQNSRRRLPRHPQGRPSQQRTHPSALPAALRPTRHQRPHDHAQSRADAPPRHRHRARPQTRPGVRRRPPRTVADLTTGEVLSVHLIQPDRSYWRNQNKEPGRWPSSKL